MKKLKRIIKKHWKLNYKQIDKNLTLIQLAEDIACKSENCTLEEAYNMYIDTPDLHLPGLIALYITDEMGVDPSKVSAGATLRDIFDL